MRIRSILIVFIVCGLVLRLYFTFGYYHGDMYNHLEWGAHALHNGFLGMYELPDDFWRASHVNQPPGTIYILTAMQGLYELFQNIIWWLNDNIKIFPSNFIYFYERSFNAVFMKIPAIFFDIGIALLLFKMAKQYTNEKMAALASIAYIWNPLTLYNSAWWGQTDATVNFFGLLALYFVTQRKLPYAYLAFATSLFIKASLLIFLPVLLLITMKQKYAPKTVVVSALVPLLLAWILSLPFHPLSDLLWFFRTYPEKIVFGSLNEVTANAFNIWALFYGPLPATKANTIVFGLQATHWGYLLFSCFFLCALYRVWKSFTVQTLLQSMIIIAFSAFLFFTGMHERYLFPIFPLFALLLAFYPKLVPLYIATSFVHLVNLYHLWWSPHVNWLVEILERQSAVLTFVYAHIILFLLFIFISSRYLKKGEQVSLIRSGQVR